MSDARGPVAVVELGSVSTKLLVTDGERRMQRTIDTMMGGSSLSPTGRLRGEPISPEALGRIEAALASFAPLIVEQGVAATRVIGTASARRAVNSSDLTDLVDRVLGVELEVLTSAEEADRSYAGVTSGSLTIGSEDSMVVIDFGGGSTEFAAGTLTGPDVWHSIPIGGALVTATYLVSDPPRPEELSAALSVIELHIDDVNRELPQLAPILADCTVFAVGAATTIAAIEVGLADVDPNNGEGDGPLQGFELTRRALEDVFRTIATESRADRAFNPGLPPSRVDEIVGACVIMVETMRQLDLDRMIVSQRGVMDGVASEMMGAQR